VDSLIAEAGGPAWDEAGFARLHERVRAELHDATLDTVAKVERILAVAHRVEVRLRGTKSLALVASLTDIRTHLSGLIFPGFVTATGRRRLTDVHRYLRAIEHRLDKLPDNPGRDRQLIAQVERVREPYERLRSGRAQGEAVERIRWMIEELRVSYFAQQLGTPYPISEKRILKAMEEFGA
jgi:ATP-dependent helicase HrpA